MTEKLLLNQLHSARYTVLKTVIEDAAHFALKFFNHYDKLAVQAKSARDFVSEADRAIELRIRKMIKERFSNDRIIGEELGGILDNAYWSVDPIDGTSNFLSGLPIWGISIAYIEDGNPVIGAVAMPALDYFVFGEIGFDLEVIAKIPMRSQTQHYVFAVGRNELWPTASRHDVESKVETAGYSIISLGSCSVSMMMCAVGKLAGYIEHNIGFWDCAAGIALCRTAKLSVNFSIGNGRTDCCICIAPKEILDFLDQNEVSV
jgi:myo-inositol-1(or 4)-monophosphatase